MEQQYSKQYSKQTARRIAYFGAQKMDEAGYTIEPMGLVPGGFYVVKPAEIDGTGAVYLVTVRDNGAFVSCTCPFFKKQGHCKHCMRCLWKVQQEESRKAHETGRRFAQDGAGLGLTCVSDDARLLKMYAHDADAIEAAALA